TVGGAEFGERDPGLQRDPAHGGGVGVGAQGAVRRRGRVDAGSGEGALQGGGVVGARQRPGGGEELLLAALGDDASLADHHDVVGDHLDLVQQVGGQQHGAAV